MSAPSRLVDSAALLDLSPARLWVAAFRLAQSDPQRRHDERSTVDLLTVPVSVDPGREDEAFDTQPAPGFACGRGLGRCKEMP